MRDGAVVETGLIELLDDLLGRGAFLALGERDGERRAGAGAAEGEQLAIASLAQGFLHFLNVGRTDAADDRDEAVADPGRGGGVLDLAREWLPGLFAVGPVVDQHGHALLRQP